MDFNLSEQEKMIRGTARDFAHKSVKPVAMQVHGAYGYMKDMEIERLYRDAKLTEIYEGVSGIQRVIIADHLLQEKGMIPATDKERLNT